MRAKDGGALHAWKHCFSRAFRFIVALKDDRARKAVIETNTRDLVNTGQNRLLAELHLRCPPELGFVFDNIIDIQSSEAPQVTM